MFTTPGYHDHLFTVTSKTQVHRKDSFIERYLGLATPIHPPTLELAHIKALHPPPIDDNCKKRYTTQLPLLYKNGTEHFCVKKSPPVE